MLKDTSGNIYGIGKVLGSGGQGVVFSVDGNDLLVIKGLADGSNNILADRERYASYSKMINKVMSIDDGNSYHIASPLALLEAPCCGYVMRFMENMEPLEKQLMPKHGEDLASFFQRTGGIKRRLVILRKISILLCQLADRGIVYSDLSPKNIYVSSNFFDSEVWLIDADNLHFDGEDQASIGTPNYRAPEVFNGGPNTLLSDEFSFALLVYRVLTMSRAFDGVAIENNESAGWDQSPESDPLADMESGRVPWCGNSTDTSNRQGEFGIRLNKAFSKGIKRLLAQTFEDGLQNPAARPSIYSWPSVLRNASQNLILYWSRRRPSEVGQEASSLEDWFFEEPEKYSEEIPDCYQVTTSRFIQVETETGTRTETIGEERKSMIFSSEDDAICLFSDVFTEKSSYQYNELPLLEIKNIGRGFLVSMRAEENPTQLLFVNKKTHSPLDRGFIKRLEDLEIQQFLAGKLVRKCDFERKQFGRRDK